MNTHEAKWIPHIGGNCPLKAGTEYSVKHRDGSLSHNRTAYSNDKWNHYGTPCDIVAYKVVNKVDDVKGNV